MKEESVVINVDKFPVVYHELKNIVEGWRTYEGWFDGKRSVIVKEFPGLRRTLIVNTYHNVFRMDNGSALKDDFPDLSKQKNRYKNGAYKLQPGKDHPILGRRTG